MESIKRLCLQLSRNLLMDEYKAEFDKADNGRVRVRQKNRRFPHLF